MNPVQKALWYVESHFSSEITLDDIAAASEVSRYYLTRAFGAATGQPLMRYVRGRRLTEAARSLANGAPDILTLALAAGYSSHEAFTRAFAEQFGCTPESVRAQGHVAELKLVEALRMDQTPLSTLQPPRFVTGKPLLFAGLKDRYTPESSAGIPAQWQRFLPHFGHVPGQVGNVAYGVMYNSDDENNFEYLAGVEVPDFSQLPANLDRLRVPAQRYVVFNHPGHIAEVRRTWNTIWNKWFPESGHEAADGPAFERYGETFDPQTGNGGFELWIPIRH